VTVGVGDSTGTRTKGATLGDRLRYQFDSVMSRRTGALVGALSGVTLLLIALASSVLVLARLKPGGSAEALGVAEALSQVTVRTIDTGTVAGDSGWSFRIVSFAITLGGIFIASTLIGVLASGLEARLSERRRGRSRVVESGHAVILGWSPQVFTIVAELALAQIAENEHVLSVPGRHRLPAAVRGGRSGPRVRCAREPRQSGANHLCRGRSHHCSGADTVGALHRSRCPPGPVHGSDGHKPRRVRVGV
jgi:hypothetical protein